VHVLARVWFAVGALVVVVALVIQIPITAAHVDDAFFTTPAARVANLFTFFTILTNLLVAATDLVLAVRPTARSTLLRVARLDAVLAITITAVVYHVLLAGLDQFSGAEELANQLWHTVSPVLTVGGWALFGPRGLVDRRIVVLSLAYPVAWLACTLVRGALIGWYPYPFLQVDELGYGPVGLYCAAITLLFLAVAAGVAGIDRLLAGRSARRAALGGTEINA
jgi:hypothetical protein